MIDCNGEIGNGVRYNDILSLKPFIPGRGGGVVWSYDSQREFIISR